MATASAGMSGGQYSLLRAATGFAALVALVVESVSVPTAGFDPQAPVWVYVVTGTAALFFAIGLFDRVAALVLALGFAGATGESFLVLAVVYALTPGTPFGAFSARGRLDPGAGWNRPDRNLAGAWLALFLLAANTPPCTGVLFIDEPLNASGRLIIQPLSAVDSGPAQPGAMSDTGFAFLRFALLLLLAAIPAWFLWRLPRLRTFAWFLFALLCAIALFNHGVGLPELPYLALLAWTFEPRWVPTRKAPQPLTVYYDGNCGLCHGFVRFLLAEDQHAVLRFAPLDSESFRSSFSEETRAELPDSIVVRSANGEMLVRSSAVAFILSHLGGVWTLAAWFLGFIPRTLRDAGYDAVARVRHRFFAKPAGACPMLPPGLAERFQA